MIAAIYARNGTEQNDVADDQKSVAGEIRMKMRPFVSAFVLGMLAVSVVSAQSLGAIAKQAEADRAKRTAPLVPKVYTNKDLVGGSSSGGIQPLTEETAKAAVTEGGTPEPERVMFDGSRVRPSPSPLNSPMMIRLRSGGGSPSAQARMEVNSMPFSFIIVTPYTMVVDLARDALRRSTTPTAPNIQVLNAGLVNIVVSPGSGMRDDVIESVIIKRGDQIFKPLKADVGPEVLTNSFGATKQSASGTFRFDCGTFAPDQAITIIFIGRAGNHEWTMCQKN